MSMFMLLEHEHVHRYVSGTCMGTDTGTYLNKCLKFSYSVGGRYFLRGNYYYLDISELTRIKINRN
jgi:hypothetical protein